MPNSLCLALDPPAGGPVGSCYHFNLFGQFGLYLYIAVISNCFSKQVQNFPGLVAIRLVLGLCEGGLLPGIVSINFFFGCIGANSSRQILYLSTIYKRHELQLRCSTFLHCELISNGNEYFFKKFQELGYSMRLVCSP